MTATSTEVGTCQGRWTAGSRWSRERPEERAGESRWSSARPAPPSTSPDAARANGAPSTTAETIEDTADLVTEAGGTGIAVPTDHLVPAEVEALVARIADEHGGLDLLVNDVWGGEKDFAWDTPLWETRPRPGPTAAAPGRRDARDHQPPRTAPAAAHPRPAWSR